jgi:hypothetical protein
MQLTNTNITDNKFPLTNRKGSLDRTKSSTFAEAPECADVEVKSFFFEQEKRAVNNDLQLTITKRRNTMKHPDAVPGGRNANQVTNVKTTNNNFSKRSNVMNANSIFSRALVAIVSIFLMATIAFGQNLNLNGASTIGGTVKVKGNINNTLSSGLNSFTGTVELRGTGAQNVGGHATNGINFANLNATTNTTKTIDVPSTLSGTADVTNSATIALAATRTLTVTGDLAQTSGSYVFNNATSTVNYGGGAQTVIGTTYTNLTTSAAGNKSMNNNVTVNSTLTLTDGALVIGAHTLDIAGALSTTTGTLTGGVSSNLSFTGTGNASLPTVTNGLQNFTLNRDTYTITLGSALTVGGTLALNNGTLAVSTQTLTLNGSVTSAGSGALTSAANGTVDYATGTQNVLAANYGNLSFTLGNKTLPAVGTVGIAGTFTPGPGTHTTTNSTVDFNGGAQNIPAFSFNNLYTSGAASTKTATGDLTIAGTFDNGGVSNNAVTLDMGIHAISKTGDNTNSTVKFGGDSNGKLFTTGTVNYSGTLGTPQTVAGHATNTYANLIFSGTASKLITSAAGLVRTLGSLSATTDIQIGANVGDTTAELDVDVDFTVGAGNITNYGVISVGL